MKKEIYKIIIYFLIFYIGISQASCKERENSSISKINVVNDWENRYEYIFEDEDGNVLFKKELRKFYGFNEGYATVILMNWDYAILDEKGNISEKRFIELGQKFSEGKNYAMFMDESTGFIDTKGNTLFKIEIDDFDGYMDATTYSNGRALIKDSDNKWFMIDDKGNILREYNFITARNFSCGLSLFQIKEGDSYKYNYMNTDGEYISTVNFDDADDFVNNIARVRIGEDVYYIDTEGNKIEK